jgi:endonuclease/exonuclease/phosphatase family metal-dependent hydrolase
VSGETLRIATWNVHGMRGGVKEIAWVVHTEEVDILLLQESGPRDRLRALGETLGMVVCADPRAFPRRRIQNAVLVRGGLATIVYSGLRRFSESSLLYPRGVLLADVDERFFMLSVHLGLNRIEQALHVAQLIEHFEGSSGSFVVGGDLNALPDDPTPIALSGQATDAWAAAGEGSGATFPSSAPSARIDYLFVGRAFVPVRAWTAGGTVSDHLMVVAELVLTESGEDEASVRGS